MGGDCFQLGFAYRHAARSVDVGLAYGLHGPTGGGEQPVDLGAGAFFRLIRHLILLCTKGYHRGVATGASEGALGRMV